MVSARVMQGEDLDGRADVYSVAGLVMWILSGVEPGERALNVRAGSRGSQVSSRRRSRIWRPSDCSRSPRSGRR